MKKTQLLAPSLISLALLGSSQSANASDDLTIVTAVAYQQKTLNFDQSYSGANIADNSAKFSTELPILNLGLTAVYKKFYVSLKYEGNLTDTSTTTNETDRSQVVEISPGVSVGPEANLLTLPGGKIDVERRDISFAVGYNVWKRLNLFVGYLDGQTEISPTPFCADFVFAEDQNNCIRTNRAGLQFFLGDQGFYDNQPAYKQTYSEKGAFAGASYNLSFDEVGSLSLSFAYASMDGEYSDNANDPDENFSDFAPFKYEGDTTGTSIAATWSGSLSPNSTYYVDFRRQSYSMDGEDTTGRLTGVSLSTDEEMLGLSLGVQFYF